MRCVGWNRPIDLNGEGIALECRNRKEDLTLLQPRSGLNTAHYYFDGLIGNVRKIDIKCPAVAAQRNNSGRSLCRRFGIARLSDKRLKVTGQNLCGLSHQILQCDRLIIVYAYGSLLRRAYICIL